MFVRRARARAQPDARGAPQNVARDPACTMEAMGIMCATRLPDNVAQMADERRFADDELLKDVDYLHSTLEQGRKDLSCVRARGRACHSTRARAPPRRRSIEKYALELAGGLLEWGPMHTSDFWKANIGAFEEDSFSLVKCGARQRAAGAPRPRARRVTCAPRAAAQEARRATDCVGGPGHARRGVL